MLLSLFANFSAKCLTKLWRVTMTIARHLPPLPAVRDIINMYKLTARKQLAQNFLLDLKVTDKIVKYAGNLKGAYVCEVGPGPGSITRSILKAQAARVIVIERDQRFMPALQYLNKALGEDLVDIYHGDVLKFDMTNIFPEHLITPWDGEHPNIHIIGNLPFNVSTPLVFQWIRDISMRSGAWRYGRVPMTLTFQHEVAERMVAPIMNKQRSRMSIITQNWCDLRFDYSINGKAFVPPPDVNVGVVCFEPRNEPIVDVSYEHLNKVVRNIFHYRQKYVHRGACTLFPPDRPELTVRLFKEAEVDPKTRPTHLSTSEYGRLALVYRDICNEHPGMLDYDYRSPENAETWRKSRPNFNK